MPEKPYENLHHHTNVSDGELSYLETLVFCQKYNISTVAFTDHDSLPSKYQVNKLRKVYPVKTDWIIGIEISSGLPEELGGLPSASFHIVGLFVNPFDKRLTNYCQKKQEARQERMKRMVKNLNQLGFRITADDCLRESQGESMGRTHIVSALKKRPEYGKIIEILKKKMKEDSLRNKKIKIKYQELIDRGPEQYPFALFLTDNAYLPGIYVNHLYSLPLNMTVSLIREAGGIAILAHWSFIKKKIDLILVEKLLREKRLDGLEIVYSHSSTAIRKKIYQDIKELKRVAELNNCLRSGGIDSHTKQNIRSFLRNKRLAPLTRGLTRGIIRHGKIDTSWSSFQN
ncbi:MAG TPA: hypothetical protein VMW41_04850 [Candidatus Bathyarchaeia archaeon]|nr:hypothetical protein [Candidatus Bathyarchaeia archaeon]